MNFVNQLGQLADRQPFRPFTMHVAGGRKHQINLSTRKKRVVVWSETDVAIFLNPCLISEVEQDSRNKK